MSRLLDAYWGKTPVSLSTLSADVDGSEFEDTDVDGGDTIEGYEDADSEVETSEGSSGEESVLADSEELNTELLDVQEDVSEIEEEEQNTETDLDAAVAVENFLGNLFWTKEQGGLTIQHTDLAVEHVRVIADKIGMPYEYAPDLEYSAESFSTVGGVQMNTEGAIESIKDFFVKILDSILKGIAFIMEKGAQLMSKLFGNYEKLREYAKKVKEKLAKANSTPGPNDSKYKSAGHRLTLMVAGKIETVQNCVSAIETVAKGLAAGWTPNKQGQIAMNIGGAALSSLEDVEKNIDASLQTIKGADVSYKDTQAKMVQTIAAGMSGLVMAMPFTNKTITSQEAKRCGVTVKEGEVASISPFLPKNKVIVTVITKAMVDPKTATIVAPIHGGGKKEVGGRFYSKLNSYKAENKGGSIEIDVENKANLTTALAGLERVFDVMEHVKKLIDAAKPAASKMKTIIWKLRTKYVAISKKAREGRGFMDNLRATRRNITLMKDIVGLLREPGASFSAYVLFTGKALLDIINKQADILSKQP